jgi:hypothetical protein
VTGHPVSQDVLFYLAFLGGQLLFILKRAASAIRSKSNPTTSRRAFLYANWDVLVIRVAIELPIYWIWRHYPVNTILSVFTSFKLPQAFDFPQGAITFFTLGFIADSLLDWFGASAKAPEWLKENIPAVTVYSSHSISSGTDQTGAPVTVENTMTVEKTAVPEAKS